MEKTLLSAFMQQSPAALWSSENQSSCTLKAFLCFCKSHLHHICISDMHMILAKDTDFYMHRSTYIFVKSLFSLQGGNILAQTYLLHKIPYKTKNKSWPLKPKKLFSFP